MSDLYFARRDAFRCSDFWGIYFFPPFPVSIQAHRCNLLFLEGAGDSFCSFPGLFLRQPHYLRRDDSVRICTVPSICAEKSGSGLNSRGDS